MLFLYLRRTKVNETAETESETGDDAKGENVIEVQVKVPAGPSNSGLFT